MQRPCLVSLSLQRAVACIDTYCQIPDAVVTYYRRCVLAASTLPSVPCARVLRAHGVRNQSDTKRASLCQSGRTLYIENRAAWQIDDVIIFRRHSPHGDTIIIVAAAHSSKQLSHHFRGTGRRGELVRMMDGW